MSVFVDRLVFVHSPLVGPETWEPVARELTRRGFLTCVPSLAGVVDQPGGFWNRCAESVAAAVNVVSIPTVLVGHSGIGPVLPHIAAACGNVAACVYVDASLPAPGACWLDSFPSPPALEDGRLVPNMWLDQATWALVGISDPERRVQLAHSSRRLPVEVYREQYPTPVGWEALRSGYLAFVPNAFYRPICARAQSLGWPAREVAGAHFQMLVDPTGVAFALLALLAEMGVELGRTPQ
jgi:hypothetical protein